MKLEYKKHTTTDIHSAHSQTRGESAQRFDAGSWTRASRFFQYTPNLFCTASASAPIDPPGIEPVCTVCKMPTQMSVSQF